MTDAEKNRKLWPTVSIILLSIITIGMFIFMGYAMFFDYHMDKRKAFETLTSHGYKNIKFNREKAWCACLRGELKQMRFVANNQNGKLIEGVVCETLTGSTTIRFK